MLKANFHRYAVPGVLALIGLVAATPISLAQLAGSATINGTVTDASGAAVAGVTITLHQTETSADRKTETNDPSLQYERRGLPARQTYSAIPVPLAPLW